MKEPVIEVRITLQDESKSPILPLTKNEYHLLLLQVHYKQEMVWDVNGFQFNTDRVRKIVPLSIYKIERAL